MKWHIERTKLRSKVKCTIAMQVLFGKICKALTVKGGNENPSFKFILTKTLCEITQDHKFWLRVQMTSINVWRCNWAFVLQTSILAHCLTTDVKHKVHKFGEIVSFEEMGFFLPRCYCHIRELFGNMESIEGDDQYRQPPRSFASPIKMGWEVSLM